MFPFLSILADICWTLTLSSAVLTAWDVYAYAHYPWNNLCQRRHYCAHFISEETEAQGATRTCQIGLMPELILLAPGVSQLFKKKINDINSIYWVICYHSWCFFKSPEGLGEEGKLYLQAVGRRCADPTQRGEGSKSPIGPSWHLGLYYLGQSWIARAQEEVIVIQWS